MTTSMQKIDSHLANLPPDSLRYQVLAATKQFRGSWVELGRLLNDMVYGGDYHEAGYDDFETYCARELGLKKPTVQKLLASYNYMKKYEHKRLEDAEEGGASDAPDYETVALLDRVRRKDDQPMERIDELHQRAFANGGENEAVKAELRGMLRPSPPASASDPDIAEKAKVLGAARKLRKEMAKTDFVPDGLRERLEQPLTELEALA